MKAQEDWIRAESIEPINGKIKINYFPPSLANNPEYMRRVGFRKVEIIIPQKSYPKEITPQVTPQVEEQIAQDIEQNYSIEEVIEAPKKKPGRKKSVKTT